MVSQTKKSGSMQPSKNHFSFIRTIGGLLIAVMTFVGAPSQAQEPHTHHGAQSVRPPAPFIASTAKSFAQLMDDAMAVMEYGMRAAPMTGETRHDFVTMMIPHHQGAVDMAKALLLYTDDPQLRNLAQGIITEQQNEIRLMQSWLKRHEESGSRQDHTPH